MYILTYSLFVKDIRHRFAKKIRFLRAKHKYSQEKLAELAGIDYKHLQKLEGKNPSCVRLDTIEKLAKAFNTDCSQLIKF